MENHKLPISAVIVTCNDAKYLRQCIEGVDYCDEIIVIDLASDDNSVNIAKKMGVKVINIERLPYVEQVHVKIPELVRNKWVLITDPDEVADDRLKVFIKTEYNKWSADKYLGSIRAPMKYYVGKKSIKRSAWGPMNLNRNYLVHLDRFEFLPIIHRGRILKKGYTEYIIPSQFGYVHHFWIENLNALIVKCRRYLKNEGVNYTEQVVGGGFFSVIKIPIITFYRRFVRNKGYEDGFIGFAIAFLISWYNMEAFIRRRYFRKQP